MTSHDKNLSPTLSPAAELAANVAVPFNQAHAMPKSVYTSPEFLALEQERIFGRDWVCAGRAESIPEPGDYVTIELAGEPIIVLRDRDGTVRAMSNVCRHRMSTLLEGRGHVRAIVCPYHAWTYNLDGSLRGAPGMTLNEGFCKSDVKLPQVRCEVWQGWVMVSLDPDAPSPEVQLAEVAGLIAPLDMSAYRQTFGQTFRWNTNWKVLAENFMESYHLPVCHAGTIGGASKLEEMVCPEGSEAFNYHFILKDDSVPLALAHPSNTQLVGDQRRTTWLLAIYPSLLITLTPGYFWYLSLTPTEDPGQVDVMFGGGMSPEWLADPAAEAHLAKVRALLDDVNIEDKGCTEKVYRGLQSGMASPGSLSHLERPNFEFAQYLARRVAG
ncbi:(2Fe-2S)-binding protein [Paracoccus suum]|uniref:(2Fe-2S)-binding protein n=1 Tax=Paracoccus suum TaxID=2259340 RepID=A0A344PJY2_9RHOB|nr:SRPBCC family protein [Paracoccus suum]AXC49687.1 (2Fe-2S)-binding protein [Paracoccus suum]